MRVMIVTPKRTYGKVPLDPQQYGPQFPYYSTTGSVYPVLLSPPISSNLQEGSGMVGLPDPKYYHLEFDDLRNLKNATSVGQDSGQYIFNIDREFTYSDIGVYSNDNIHMDDHQFRELIP